MPSVVFLVDEQNVFVNGPSGAIPYRVHVEVDRFVEELSRFGITAAVDAEPRDLEGGDIVVPWGRHSLRVLHESPTRRPPDSRIVLFEGPRTQNLKTPAGSFGVSADVHSVFLWKARQAGSMLVVTERSIAESVVSPPSVSCDLRDEVGVFLGAHGEELVPCIAAILKAMLQGGG